MQKLPKTQKTALYHLTSVKKSVWLKSNIPCFLTADDWPSGNPYFNS